MSQARLVLSRLPAVGVLLLSSLPVLVWIWPREREKRVCGSALRRRQRAASARLTFLPWILRRSPRPSASPSPSTAQHTMSATRARHGAEDEEIACAPCHLASPAPPHPPESTTSLTLASLSSSRRMQTASRSWARARASSRCVPALPPSLAREVAVAASRCAERTHCRRPRLTSARVAHTGRTRRRYSDGSVRRAVLVLCLSPSSETS